MPMQSMLGMEFGGGEPRFGVAAEARVVEMKIQLRGEVLAR
jgi:hypothetical protein